MFAYWLRWTSAEVYDFRPLWISSWLACTGRTEQAFYCFKSSTQTYMEKKQAKGRGGVPTLGQSKVRIDRTAKYACFAGYVACEQAFGRAGNREPVHRLQAKCGFVSLLKCGFPVGDFYLKKVLSHNRGVASFYPAVFKIFDILIKNKTQTAVINVVSFRGIFINVTETRSAE